MLLEDLRGRHEGETIWVLGSGPSLNFIDPSFFADKTVVSTNFSATVSVWCLSTCLVIIILFRRR
jgi:hypothetical protein